MQRVKVHNQYCGSLGSRCFVGEHELHGVREVDFHMSVWEVPEFVFTVAGCPDMEIMGEVGVKFHPETLRDACKVLQVTYRDDEVFRKAFVESVRSALDGVDGEKGQRCRAMYLADYIMGVE